MGLDLGRPPGLAHRLLQHYTTMEPRLIRLIVGRATNKRHARSNSAAAFAAFQIRSGQSAKQNAQSRRSSSIIGARRNVRLHVVDAEGFMKNVNDRSTPARSRCRNLDQSRYNSAQLYPYQLPSETSAGNRYR